MTSTQDELIAERDTIRKLINRALKPQYQLKDVELRALFEMLRKVERKIEQSNK